MGADSDHLWPRDQPGRSPEAPGARAAVAPDVLVYAIGALELAGGLLLAARRWVRPAALLLAGDMVGAITVSGIARGGMCLPPPGRAA